MNSEAVLLPRQRLTRLVTASVILAVLLGGVVRDLYQRRKGEVRGAAAEMLGAIADLKAKAILDWLKERRGAAETALDKVRLRALLAHPEDQGAQADLRRWMTVCRRAYGYAGIAVLNAQGTVLLADPGPAGFQGPRITGCVISNLASPEVVCTDWYQDPPAGGIHLDVLAPIRGQSAVSGPADGMLVFRVDPNLYFFPMLQRWPTASRSGETLLVKRELNEVVFANELRFLPHSALQLRVSPAARHLRAALASSSADLTFEEEDYRGVPVLAVARPIPGTGWLIVAKLDTSEVYAGLRHDAWSVGSLAGSLLLAAGLGLSLRRRQQKLDAVRAELSLREQANAELERRVEERTAQLKAANQELDSFCCSVSHDLRAPLRAILGFARVLGEEHAQTLDPEGLRLLGVIRGKTEFMRQLIDDLLDFSRLGRRELRRSQIDLEEMTRGIFQELRETQPERGLKLTLEPLPPAWGDPAMIRQMLTNLLSNAIKFTRPAAVAEITVGSRQLGLETVYRVADNGVGFDMKYAGKLFGVFQRLHSEGEFEGTGVGLALVQRVVQRHGGRVWAEARPRFGATFYFTLPAAPAPVASPGSTVWPVAPLPAAEPAPNHATLASAGILDLVEPGGSA